MHVKAAARRSIIALGISFIVSAPQLHAAPVGGVIGRAVAEQLGLLVSQVPENWPIGATVLITVVDAARLVSQGLTGLTANDQVRVTLLDGGKLSIVPVLKTSTNQTTISSSTSIKSSTIISPTTTAIATKQSLLLTVDSKGTILNKQIVPLADAKLNIDATQILKR